jgi:hypothetical protein
MVLCWAAGFCFGLLRPAHGLPFPDLRFILWPTQGMQGRAQDRRRTRAAAAATVAARRRIAGIELRSMVSRSEGMGRERRARGFRSGDSGHG